LVAVRTRGGPGSRTPISPDDPRLVTAKRLNKDRILCINQICSRLGISKPTFYRYQKSSDKPADGY